MACDCKTTVVACVWHDDVRPLHGNMTVTEGHTEARLCQSSSETLDLKQGLGRHLPLLATLLVSFCHGVKVPNALPAQAGALFTRVRGSMLCESQNGQCANPHTKTPKMPHESDNVPISIRKHRFINLPKWALGRQSGARKRRKTYS